MKNAYRVITAIMVLSGGIASAATKTEIYSFGAYSGDGKDPEGALVFNSNGVLYGTVSAGGLYGFGAVFKLTPPARIGGKWTETILYSFKGAPNGDGANPQAGLVLDDKGVLYGTTISGGTSNKGTVFRLTQSGIETVLYSFTGDGDDGAFPVGGISIDQRGNIYGVTEFGGGRSLLPQCQFGGCGTVFKVSPYGQRTTLYAFTGLNGDGAIPLGAVVLGKGRNHKDLYGSAEALGAFGYGEIFSLKAE